MCGGCGEKTINIPLIGEVLLLSVVILPFCAAFAIFWAANQHASYAWIGQDILVSFLLLMFPLFFKVYFLMQLKLHWLYATPCSPRSAKVWFCRIRENLDEIWKIDPISNGR